MNHPEITLAAALEHGLLEEEYERIIRILGRKPTFTELGIFSVMWSEHCSYKNSIIELKKLPRSGGRLLVSAGEENAGLVDIGDGLAVAFKIESHNHPSAVEPYQGAATGVGGILRDIFTMGARPVAALNSLRFGLIDGDSEEKNTRSKFLFSHVVRGIGGYGNCFGVPTVAGEVYFDDCYHDNPLVNAMAVGIVEHDKVATAKASGTGNPVFIVGSSTGKDGIHGATFASEEISEESESKRPNVQVGDPFTEKLLLEATLEVIRAGIVEGIQDMGAAGITCSTSEMSAKGNCGMRIDLDNVPLRDIDMSAYEIMLSESQERMLVVVKMGREDEAVSIFEKWDLNCVRIGEVTEGKEIVVYHKGELVAEIPAEELVLGGGAPVYVREKSEPEYFRSKRSFDFSSLEVPDDLNSVLSRLLSSPNIASKKWVYTQYDSQVGTNTSMLPGGDASLVRIKDSRKALAMKVDCNSRYVYLNPYKGGMIAVCECARNVACTGAVPLAITNCLNFGNPYNPEVYFQFSEAVRGIGDACKILNTPVTGGNVSFYNQSKDYAVYPTPTIGMIGLLEDVDLAVGSGFKNAGDDIILLGDFRPTFGGSEYMNRIFGLTEGDSPEIDPDAELRLIKLMNRLAVSKLINSAHDISDGGLAVALAECCITGGIEDMGCNANIAGDAERNDLRLFGESQGCIIISCSGKNSEYVIQIAGDMGVKSNLLGKTTSDSTISIDGLIVLSSSLARESYFGSIPGLMKTDHHQP
ncbi:MAG: phosphoribosylformylglycinamidine synthase subunit PurL [Ignavibacteria bacterium]|nr:phosphoribosylformylglycinamidine synthase subunit PurL [Ignavibacteria bacterium]